MLLRWTLAMLQTMVDDGQRTLCLLGTPASSETAADPASLESGTLVPDMLVGKQHLILVQGRSGHPLPGQRWCCQSGMGKFSAREEGASSWLCSPQTLACPGSGYTALRCHITQHRDADA